MKVQIKLSMVIVMFLGLKAHAGTFDCAVVISPNHDQNYTQPIVTAQTQADVQKQVVLMTDALDKSITFLSFNPVGPSLELAVTSPSYQKIYALSLIANISSSNSSMLYDSLHDRMIVCNLK